MSSSAAAGQRRPQLLLLGVFAASAAAFAAVTLQGCGEEMGAQSVGLRTLQERKEAQPVVVDPKEPRYDYYILCPFGNVKALDNFLDPAKYDLKGLLTSGKYRGILTLYVLPQDVWQSVLDFTNSRAADPAAKPPQDAVDLKQQAHDYREKLPPTLKDERRVRILTPLDLDNVMLSIHRHLGNEKFQHWFGHATYDAPKFAGFMMRIRGQGNNVPVIRLDTGVLFNFHTAKPSGKMDGVRALVEATVDDYMSCIRDVFSQSFMVSQQYTGVLADNGTIPFDTWNEAYATQAVPPLLATPEMCDASQFSGVFPTSKYFPSGEVVQAATNAEVFKQFYGLAPQASSLYLEAVLPSADADDTKRREEDATNMGLAYIGGNPTHSLISGAALTTGPGVALDMPPMIHTDLFIMWIDDHLFDRMTSEVLATKRRAPPTGVGKARFPDVRNPQKSPARFTLEFYMPTLTMGAVFDKWINAHPDAHLLKFRGERLPTAVQDKLAAVKPVSGDAQGPFTRAMQEVRFQGAMLAGKKLANLTAELWSTALSRLQDCYWQWSRLPEPEVDGKPVPAFASLWARGAVCEHPPTSRYCDSTWEEVAKPCKGKFCVAAAQGMVKAAWDEQAKGAKSRATLPELTQKDLNPAFKSKIEELIKTATTHLEWAVDWAEVVQAIRSIPQGEVRTDIQFKSLWLQGLPITAYEARSTPIQA